MYGQADNLGHTRRLSVTNTYTYGVHREYTERSAYWHYQQLVAVV
jgi:hypothetical protein